MTDSADAVKDGLEVCGSVELACANLYHYFAEHFKADRENFLLWLKAAMEEENHARLFALLGKLRGNNEELTPVKSFAAELMLMYVESLIETVQEQPLSMKDALNIAIELEAKMDAFLKEDVVKMAGESYEQSFLNIAVSGSKHLQLLKETYDRLQID